VNRSEASPVTSTRQATPEDVHAMLACDAYAKANASRASFLSAAVEKRQCVVAVEAGDVIGYVVLTHDFFENGFVYLVVVSPAHQRKGVGLRLLAAAEAACRTPKLFTSTNSSNLASQTLIEKAGFVRSGVIDNLDEGDPERVYFKRVR
jgi:RimJ/RimL family protein N-acetyltransferase